MAKLIRFDGTEEEVFPVDKEGGFTLGEMYTLLGCEMIEVVYLANEKEILIIDEEGKLRKDWLERLNEKATQLFFEGRIPNGDIITGNALLIVDDGTEFQ